MSKNFIKRNKNTITQCTRMPYGAYRALRTLATDHNAKIVEAENGYLTLTFDEVKTAEQVANKFRAEYAEAHAAYVPKPAPTPTQEAKPRDGKGNAKLLKKLDKLAGKGKSANKQAAAIIREFGIEPNGAEWDYWKSIR